MSYSGDALRRALGGAKVIEKEKALQALRDAGGRVNGIFVNLVFACQVEGLGPDEVKRLENDQTLASLIAQVLSGTATIVPVSPLDVALMSGAIGDQSSTKENLQELAVRYGTFSQDVLEQLASKFSAPMFVRVAALRRLQNTKALVFWAVSATIEEDLEFALHCVSRLDEMRKRDVNLWEVFREAKLEQVREAARQTMVRR